MVYEDEEMLAFKDINPMAPTHLLILPKKHIPMLKDIEDGDVPLLGKIQKTINELAKQHRIENGFRVVVNNGTAAGQSVDHLHYHLMGGRKFNWPPG